VKNEKWKVKNEKWKVAQSVSDSREAKSWSDSDSPDMLVGMKSWSRARVPIPASDRIVKSGVIKRLEVGIFPVR